MNKLHLSDLPHLGQGRRRGNNGRRGGRRGGRGGRGGRSGRGGARTVDPVLLVNGLSNSTGAFSWDLYRRMASSNTDNFVFSPLSVYAAMGMLLLGSQGNPRDLSEGYSGFYGFSCRDFSHKNQ